VALDGSTKLLDFPGDFLGHRGFIIIVEIAAYQNVTLIYNPCAGALRRKRDAPLRRAMALLEAHGYRVQAAPTPGPGTAGSLARQAIEEGAELILVLGGDGTVNETASGMIGSRVPLGVLPAGTANVLARELGLGCNMLKAAARVPECVPQRIAVGLLRMDGYTRSRHFLLMAGVGFDGHIVYHLNLELKSRLGQLAYWSGALRQVARRPEEFEVQVEERRYRCSFALASRTRNYAGYLEMARHASLLGEDFAVVLFEGRSTFRYYARYLPAVLAGRLPRTSGITVLRARKLTYTAAGEAPIHVQVDGEYAGRLPASVEIVPDALSVLAPPEFARVDAMRIARWTR
jgi:YegS/Rv2252/BmrU family lipid kinase